MSAASPAATEAATGRARSENGEPSSGTTMWPTSTGSATNDAATGRPGGIASPAVGPTIAVHCPPRSGDVLGAKVPAAPSRWRIVSAPGWHARVLIMSSPRVVAPPAHWESDVVLLDGGTVHVRPIRLDDGSALVAFHGRLSPDTVYFRFFTAKPTLSTDEVEHFTHVDHDARVALVAELDDRIVAVARYDRTKRECEAEVAFVVADEHQGRGIATVLLEHLASAARERGITRFVAETLSGNRRMLDVFRAAGFDETARYDDDVVHVGLAIEPTERARAAMEAREHRAESRSVARLLTPRSVVVIGASRQPATVGHQVLRNLLAGGFAGPVYPVNPGAAHVASVKAYPTVLDVPDDVDLAVVAVPAAPVLDVLEQCGRKGVAGLVVLSAGFDEVAGGAGAQAAVRDRARSHG